MACTGTGTTINFQNNCLICLEPESPSRMMELLKTNPNLLRTFQPVLHYLTGTDPTYTKSQMECKAKGLPVMVNLPPLCVDCYNLTSSIYRLHAELLECQVNIQNKTEQVRKIVSSTKKFTHPPIVIRRTRRNLFLHRLQSSGMSEGEVDGMRRFVQRLHDTIVEQGSNKVIFPSEPPPNFIPLPKFHNPQEAQPLILLQLPASSAPTPVPEKEEEILPTNSSSPPPSPPYSVPIITSVVSKAVPSLPRPSNNLISEKSSPVVSTSSTIPNSRASDIVMLPSGNQALLKFENEGEDEDDQQNHDADDHPPMKVDTDKRNENGDNDLNNFGEPLPIQVIIKEEPEVKPTLDKVTDEDSSSDWELDTQNVNEDNIQNDEDEEEEEIIPKKRRKKRKAKRPPSPSSLSSHPKSPQLQHQQQQPPLIYPAPLPQHQAAQILLHLSVPFHQAPPAPPHPPSSSSSSLYPQPPLDPKLPAITPHSPTVKRKPPEKLPCEICNEYRPLNHIKPHLLAVHHGIKGHSCPLCHKIFISSSRLVHHWETRACGKDPSIIEQIQTFYTCLTCPRPEKKHNLTQMSTHIFSCHERDTGLPKCHVCGICKLKFRTKLGLDFHLNLHTYPSRKLKDHGKFRAICPPDPNWRKKKKLQFFEKPNFNSLKAPCDKCQVNYNCRYLETHLIEKHGISKEDLEKCDSCMYRSTKKESLQKHMKICHKKEMAKGITTTNVIQVTLKESQSVENGN